MATKERAGGRLLRFPRRDTVNLSRRAFMGMAEAGVGFLLGLCCRGRRSLGSIPPSGGGRSGGGRVGDQRVLHPGRGLPGVPLSGGDDRWDALRGLRHFDIFRGFRLL
ncbi:MAG: hypothetical protein ACLT9P_04970 [Evtepia gabavorous]